MKNRLSTLLLSVGVLSGCSALNTPDNVQETSTNKSNEYSLNNAIANNSDSDVTLILTFSGGGTRAAALSYGVLEQLRDTEITVNGKTKRLVDEVDVISSVSGGSFTSSYYGLYQDKIFTDYKDDFLYRDVKDDLLSVVFSPAQWFSDLSRTDVAQEYYQENIFGAATFADMKRENAPYVIVNASDITTGLRFSFIQEYFNLLCSDVNSYPVSNAVAASAAVPVLFEPVVLQNYDGCGDENKHRTSKLTTDSLSYQTQKTVQDIQDYADKEKNQYIHLVDGGITDNLGLLAIYDLMELGQFHHKMTPQSQIDTHHVVVISVDASTTPELGIGQSVDFPSVAQTLNSITDIQLHRYNDATKGLFDKSMKRWAEAASNDKVTVVPHFITIGFDATEDEEQRFILNQVPTDLTLDKEIVDMLIEEGSVQLKNNEQFTHLLNKIAQ